LPFLKKKPPVTKMVMNRNQEKKFVECTKKEIKTMDKFEQMMKDVKGMSAAEMTKELEKYKNVCICPKCPTHNKCAKNANEILFCLVGKSFMCISEDKGCICPTCPNTPEFGLKNKSFCMKGAEKAQRYEHALWGTKMP
jgi:hypothetical protein